MTDGLSLGRNEVPTGIYGSVIQFEGDVLAPKIDATDYEVDLELGTDSYHTQDVKLSRSGKKTIVQGTLEVNEGIDEVNIKNLYVGESDAAGEIDSGGTEISPQDLKLGTGAVTEEVIIARENKLTTTQGPLKVGRDIAGGDGRSKIDAYTPPGHGWTSHLKIGTSEDTDNVFISRSAENIRTIIQSELRVGVDEVNGKIDAYEDLCLGTLGTNDVEIGRTGKKVTISGRLDAEEHVRVGDANTDGMIDAADDVRDLKIGTQSDYTGNLILSRAGKVVDIKGTTRFNKKEVVINDAESVTSASGCGFKYNSVGHPGPNMPCIDFYVLGSVVGYIDSTGWHNV